MLEEYKVSEKEIVRREKAFLALTLSLFLGIWLASIILSFPISKYIFGCVAVVFVVLNLWLKKFFDDYLKSKIYLSDDLIAREKGKRRVEFRLKVIKEIKIKRTTRNEIREVYLKFLGGESLFINGMSEFDELVESLMKKIDKMVQVKNSVEIMDFDGVWFYPTLGLILSFLTVGLFKLMMNMGDAALTILFYVAVVYVFGVALYLVISKPIAKRY